jgi:hypothetical protein
MLIFVQAMTAPLLAQPSISQSLLPTHMQGKNGTNAQRLPCAYWLSLSGLTPNATYRYFNQVVRSSDSPTSSGAGNVIFANPAGFTRSSSPGMSSAGSYGELTADGSGNCRVWMVTEPTGNARFTAGGYVFFRVMLNDGNGGTAIATRLTTADSVHVLTLASTAADSSGTGIRGQTMAVARDFVLLYDNLAGTGRPLAATFLENDGSDNSAANNFVPFYADSVNTIEGAFGALIPNLNAAGVKRVERRASNGSIVAFNQSVSGIWPSGANTVNPTGAAVPVSLTMQDAPLTSSENVLPSITGLGRNPLSPVSNSVVYVSAHAHDLDGTIYSATLYFNPGNGYQSVAMLDDGLHDDSAAGDGRFGAQIPIEPSLALVHYYLDVVDNSGATVRYPADAPAHALSYQVDRPQPVLRINEFMAQNTATIQDPTGEWADWLEIFNPGTDTIRLEGFGLTDDYSDLHQWVFPDTFITPAGFLLIWCDEDEGDAGIHANFKLSTGGEQVAISDIDGYGGMILDSASFGQQTPDVSYARGCDGSTVWGFNGTPSPGVTNGLCQPAGLTASPDGTNIVLTWAPSPGAIQYRVFRVLNADDPPSAGTLVATVRSTTATLTDETANLTKAFYLVVAVRP